MIDRIFIARLFAACTTLLAVSMSAVSGLDRGGSIVDQALLIGMGSVISVGSHLLLAISRRRVTFVVWSGCLALSLLQHVTFFTHSSIRAGVARAEASMQVAEVSRQQTALFDALANIKARPVTEVAAELAQVNAFSQRSALKAELAEAQRAARLRDELVIVAASARDEKVAQIQDPVTARLAAVTGKDEQSIDVTVSFLFAVIFELLGALLWFEALRQTTDKIAPEAAVAVMSELPPVTRDPAAVTPATAVTPEPLEAAQSSALTEMEQLHRAVAAGRCKPTVRGIRDYLSCGQARAIALAREVAGVGSDCAGRDCPNVGRSIPDTSVA